MASYRSSKKRSASKDKVTVNFRHKASGEVVGEIVSDKGEVVASKHFGIMSAAEFRSAMKHIEKEFPDAIVPDIIELTGN